MRNKSFYLIDNFIELNIENMIKKFIFVLFAFVAMASCGGNATDSGHDNDSINIDSIEVVDTIAADSVCLN